MTAIPRFLRHRDLSSEPLWNKESGFELHHKLPLTTIAKTLVNFYDRQADDTIHNNDWYLDPMNRLLAGDGGGEEGASYPEGADYSIFSIVISTLGLILFTETILHVLDHYAKKDHKFFRKTLNTCYRELAILGIVEWMVHLYHLYGNYDENLLKAFADVHYLLFYTAIFNAIQSLILFLACKRQTLSWWVKAEELELYHYIELRVEFERLKQKLRMRMNTMSEETMTLQNTLQFARKTLTHPVLLRKYHQLLVQVRFHELRISFIRANKLPLKFRVSEYLRKCEQEVLMRFIKISTFAWISLMAATNLMYFALSMVIAATHGDAITVDLTKYLFIGICVFFIVLTSVLYYKVKHIFFQIMHTPLIQSGSTAEPTDGSEHDVQTTDPDGQVADAAPITRSTSQLDLFWGKNPGIIIYAIQFMQFGYAMLLSFVIVYWTQIQKIVNGQRLAIILLFLCLVCFAIFLVIMTRIVPRFILCTNIGQLVNTIKLREVLATHRLEETIKSRRNKNAGERGENFQVFTSSHGGIPVKSKHGQIRRGIISEESHRFSRLAELVSVSTEKLPVKLQRNKGMTKLHEATNIDDNQSSFVSDRTTIAESLSNSIAVDSNVTDESQTENACNDATQQAGDGVTSARHSWVSPRKQSVSESVNVMRLPEFDKRSREKNISVGVSSMRLPEVKESFHFEKSGEGTQASSRNTGARSKRRQPNRRKCASEGVAAMQLTSLEHSEAARADEEAHFGKLAELVTMSTKDLPKVSSYPNLKTIEENITDSSGNCLEGTAKSSIHSSRQISRQRQMKKSFSEGVASMRAASIFEHVMPRPIAAVSAASLSNSPAENYNIIEEPQTESGYHDATQQAGEGVTSAHSIWLKVSEGVNAMRLPELDRRPKRRSISDGVSAMRLPEVAVSFPLGKPDEWKQDSSRNMTAHSQRTRPNRRKYASEGVAAMCRSSEEQDHFEKLAELVTMPTKELSKVLAELVTTNGFRKASSLSDTRTIEENATDAAGYVLEGAAKSSIHSSRKISRRTRMNKSFSEGVASMRAASIFDNAITYPVAAASAVCNTGVGQVDAHTEADLRPSSGDITSMSSVPSDALGIKTKIVSKTKFEEYIASNHQTDDAYSEDINAFAKATLNECESGQTESLNLHTYHLGEEPSRDVDFAAAKDTIKALGSSGPCDIDPTDSIPHLISLRSFFLPIFFTNINLCCTMACFFLVGMRMNTLLYLSGVIVEAVVLSVNASTLFWAEVALLILICLEGLVRLYSFAPRRNIAGEASMCITGVFGCILGLLCAVLLLISEALRPSKYGNFGSRASAGMGIIEPFTSLIFLRFFYVPFGNHMSVLWSKSKYILKRVQHDRNRDLQRNSNKHSLDNGRKTTNCLGGHASRSDTGYVMGKETGTIVELWQIALGLFPDIVDEYGEFSGEMLQVMLGIPIEVKHVSKTRVPGETESITAQTSSMGRLGVLMNTNTESINERPSLKMDPVVCAFDPLEVQPQTLAVAFEHEIDDTFFTGDAAAIIATDATKTDEQLALLDLNGPPPPLASRQHHNLAAISDLEYAGSIDEHQADAYNSSMLIIEPDAPLICSMRRCERRLLPLLSNWTVVDVVLTEFEIVYFDVTDVKANDDSVRFSVLQQRRDMIMDALIATEGGRRMLLRDVAIGRKIVGHVDLRYIDLVTVQRHLSPTFCEEAVSVNANSDFIQSEYWKPKSKGETHETSLTVPDQIRVTNKTRWERVQEDQLKVSTPQGVLYLRFFSDLEEQEMKLMNASSSPAQTSEALAWGQAMSQLRFRSMQLAGEVDCQRERANCDVEIVARELDANIPHRSWAKIKTLKTMILLGGHNRRASADSFGNLTANEQQIFATDVASDAVTESTSKKPSRHRRTLTDFSREPIILDPVAQPDKQCVDVLPAKPMAKHRRSKTTPKFSFAGTPSLDLAVPHFNVFPKNISEV